MRISSTVVFAAAVFFAAAFVRSDDGARLSDPPKWGKPILDAVGDEDPSGPFRLSNRLDVSRIRQAMYSEDRAIRLIAVDTAAFVRDPWPLLPYLAALMGARDRQTSSRAAQSLILALSRLANDPINRVETVPGQARQLAEQLKSLAVDTRLDVDIRVSSVVGVGLLGVYDKRIGFVEAQIVELFKDEDVVVKQAALAAVRVPVSQGLVSVLAKMSREESDPRLKGQTAALLCENAVAHGAKAPSKDLKELLETVLGDASMPGDGIGSIIACLSRFSQEARADLMDIALRHPDPTVSGFAKSIGAR